MVSSRVSDDRNSDQNSNPDDGGLSIHVPRKISGGSSSIRHHNLQLLAFVGILALLLQFGSKMGGIIQPPKDGRTYERMLTSPVKRHHQRQEVLRKAIFYPLVKAVLGMNPDAFWASIVDDNDDPCSLYLAPSSIPETGWGWFAGKNYTAGEAIRTERGHKHNFLAAISPPSATSSASTTTSEMPPTTSTKGMEIGGGVAQWSFLLKPHSVLSNVKWVEGDDDSSSSPVPQAVSILIATRDIVEGEEFFLSWEDHPYGNGESGSFGHVIADSLPSPDHFLRADEHIRDARTQYFGTINYTTPENGETTKPKPKIKRANFNGRWNNRNKKRKASSQQQLYKVESTREIETGLSLWQRAVDKYDPLVAKLLPTKVKALVMYHQKAVLDETLFSSSSMLGSLRNQTVRSLAKDARCVSSLEWQQQPTAAHAESKDDGSNFITESSKATATTTTTAPDASESEQQAASCASSGSHYHQIVTKKRGFAKGEVVGVLPLLVLQQPSYDAQQEPSALSKDGTGTCLPISSSSASPMAMIICPLGGIYEQANDLGLANVEYRWSKNSIIDGIPPGTETLQKHSISLSWDIVALRDLQQNETVRLNNCLQVFGRELHRIQKNDMESQNHLFLTFVALSPSHFTKLGGSLPTQR